MKSEDSLRRGICEIGQRLYERGYIAGGDGNISVRLDGRTLLATPTGAHKGRLRAEDLVRTDLGGRPLGRGRPSSEMRLHVLVYEQRPDITAVLHAHPVHAVALSLVGASLNDWVLPETVLTLGSVPTAQYATPGTDELPHSVQPELPGSNAIILARHGTLTLGRSLEEAFDRLENLEHTARILAAARAMGPVEPLDEAQRARLVTMASQLGLQAVPRALAAPGRALAQEDVGAEILRRVLQRLGA